LRLPGIGAASLAQRDSLLLCDDVRPRLTDAHDGVVQLGQPIAEIMHGCASLLWAGAQRISQPPAPGGPQPVISIP
jgi:hypothetical protein